jgi:hypothetical protein
MEFLNPEEKKAKTKKLFMAYGLAVVAVVSITTVLSFVLQGVDLLSRQTEAKNGLLFVNSQPISSNIFIDDKPNKRTESRFVLPEGSYNLKLTEPGYRDWQKQVQVVGGQVRYEIYPWLFPTNIKTDNIVSYTETPPIYTQSLDKKWLIVAPSRLQTALSKYDLGDPTLPSVALSIPPNIINNEEMLNATFTEIEWANNNKQVLFKKSIANGPAKYILIDIEKPEQSIDLNALFALSSESVFSLRDQKADKFYILDKTTKILKSASISNGIEPKVYAENVIDYKTYGNEIIMYTTNSGSSDGFVAVRVINNNENYLLEPIKNSPNVYLDIATYENEYYYITGSKSNESVNIYINPLSQTPNIVDNGVISSQLKLQINDLAKVSFSPNTRFIAGQSGQDFVVYDAELTKTYQFKAPLSLANNNIYEWMDGHRFISFDNNGLINIFEFDGQNNQIILPNLGFNKVYFDKDYKFMINLVKSQSGGVNLQQSNLRAPN